MRSGVLGPHCDCFSHGLKIVAWENLALLREGRRYIVANYANLAPGSTVPVSGNYRCFFCGEGGIADFMAKALGDLPVGGLNSDRKPIRKRFDISNGVSSFPSVQTAPAAPAGRCWKRKPPSPYLTGTIL